MTYDVLMLQSPDELSNCPIFRIDQFNWGGDYRPVTVGRLGYVEKSAFSLKWSVGKPIHAVLTSTITIRFTLTLPWKLFSVLLPTSQNPAI